MCGIWFSLGFAPDPKHLDVVAHRGPDGQGWRVFDTVRGPLALGHQRLSIIDLSDAATQPMASADGRYWITYNGEIYNYIELREELIAAGRRFLTSSDTEVLLAAYAQWGGGSARSPGRNVRVRALGQSGANRLCRPRPLCHQAAVFLLQPAGRGGSIRNQATRVVAGVLGLG